MVRKISKVMALIFIATIMSTAVPKYGFNIAAKAAVNSSDSSINSVTLSSADEEAALETVEEAMIPAKLNSIYSNVSATATVSQFEKCGNISYTLDDSAAEDIATILKVNMTKIVVGVTAVENGGKQLIAYGQLIGSQDLIAKGTKLKLSAEGVLSELNTMANLSDTEIAAIVKVKAEDIPVYKYTVVSGGSIVAQGFAAGGTLGLALNPVDIYNGTEKTATYSSSNLIPALPLTGNTPYNKAIDLSNSGINIICDGLNINVIDSSNNKVYAINNPVYNMLQVSSGIKSLTSKDILNVIDFPNVTNLKGTTSDIDISSKGISTKVLGLSLTASDSKNKNYEYALPVGDYEKTMLDDTIDNTNLGSVGNTLKGLIKAGTYIMIPNVNSEIDNVIDNVTNGLDNISDAINDLTDALKDKNDDVDDAWDKVFDRFDNEPGWGKKDGYRYYYDKDGVSLKGVQKINGKTYYFNRIDGAMETGWQIVDGKRCYFDKKKGYELFNQWIQDGEDRYYVGEDGVVKKMEWVNDGGKSYYLKADGKMTKDWLKIEDYWYYFDKNGVMETSTWKWSDGKWFYLKDNGQAANAWIQLGGKWYHFKDPSGELQTGWFRADGNWYYSNDDGSMKTGWVSSEDGWCFLDEDSGKMKKNEWVTIDGKTYYFNINGAMITGSRYINGTKYLFASDGTLNE